MQEFKEEFKESEPEEKAPAKKEKTQTSIITYQDTSDEDDGEWLLALLWGWRYLKGGDVELTEPQIIIRV